jgi:hypothetical protein
VTIARHTRWQVILQHIKQGSGREGRESDIVKFNSFSHTEMRLENQKQRITAMNFIALKRQERKETRFVISTPSAKLRVNSRRNLS